MAMMRDPKTLTPPLRFPDFVEDGSWSMRPLNELCERVVEKVGDVRLTPVSITAGRGFVSQADKFGRDISGAQYRSYIRLRRGEFAYNKGNSNLYPQGCVYQLKEFDEAAASNAFICFRLKAGNAPEFFEGLFAKNAHGLQLLKHLTSGARSDGLLNIKAGDFFGVRLPIPPSPVEQRKIATCLASLDELIAAEGRSLEALRAHKTGLMEQLFPRQGESHPSLRFAEFRNAGNWDRYPLGALLSRPPEYGVNAPAVSYSPDLPTYIRITDIDVNGTFLRESKASVDIDAAADHYLADGDVVLARTGASVGKSYRYRSEDGRLVFAGFLIRVSADKSKLDPVFLSAFLASRQYWDWVRATSARSGQPGINGTEYASLPVPLPPRREGDARPAEQQRIAACLSSLDALIAAASRKMEGLHAHKKGLMQQLFPSPALEEL